MIEGDPGIDGEHNPKMPIEDNVGDKKSLGARLLPEGVIPTRDNSDEGLSTDEQRKKAIEKGEIKSHLRVENDGKWGGGLGGWKYGGKR